LTSTVQGIPSSEVLRQAALHASWARDRSRRRRKLAWRWTEWLVTRWIFPVVMAGALGWVPASLQLPVRLVPDERSLREGLHFSPAIEPNGPREAQPSAIEEPKAGISLRPDQQLKPKEKK